MQRRVERKEIVYDKIRGCFWFYFKHDYDKDYGLYHLGFCPYCGAELHKDLIDEMELVLENEYDIKLCDVNLNDPKTLPKEFQTDEWWKKRGL